LIFTNVVFLQLSKKCNILNHYFSAIVICVTALFLQPDKNALLRSYGYPEKSNDCWCGFFLAPQGLGCCGIRVFYDI